ncbi:MAG: hypothetical protein J7577_08145 [Sphingobacteriaceae bacterium]|nr:hypothetical protein [Sphingobacteriaceae bacterium]
MNKLLSILILLFAVDQSFAQTTAKTNDIVGQSYVTKTSIAVKVYDPLTKKVNEELSFLLNDGIKFYIYEVVDSGYIISVWDFTQDEEKKTAFYKQLGVNKKLEDVKPDEYYKMPKTQVGIAAPKDSGSPFDKYKNLAYVDQWANNAQFFMSLKDFNNRCESIYPHKRGFTWGFLTLPIKARFGNKKAPFTFEEKINFGVSAGVKWQHVGTVYSASNLLGGVSVGGVKLDKDNSASAVSLSAGYMYQYDKFQIGIFTGLDFIDKSGSVNWGYQGKPWLGFAIGVSLFGESKTSASTDQTQ